MRGKGALASTHYNNYIVIITECKILLFKKKSLYAV